MGLFKDNKNIEQTFLMSSILMRPPYIGKSNKLSKRYNDHITNSGLKIDLRVTWKL